MPLSLLFIVRFLRYSCTIDYPLIGGVLIYQQHSM
eukprot:COSAG02_NODE_10807_length_1855_cov_1.517084_1_plen_34_part_10